MGLEEQIQKLNISAEALLEKSAELAEKAIEEYDKARLYDRASEMTELAIEEYGFLIRYHRHNETIQMMKEAETALPIALYIGQKKRLEAGKTAYALEQKGYGCVVMINSAEPDDLDISINGVKFECREAERTIKRLLDPDNRVMHKEDLIKKNKQE